jgi:hypothetical protein
MATDHRARLRETRTFPQLVAYLRDEMDWPIGSADFEELTFEYAPEELGIDPENAAKIQEIKRLRPLAANQPWGIFFVKFEPKRLPVVALRRILGRVALKKRASANSAERQSWAADDLLFISNFGEGDERCMSFAHFSTPRDGRDLPTLKVLGWDNHDTPLHLDDVAVKLTRDLAWPGDESDGDSWRGQWRAAFTLHHGEVINTSKDLSLRLAELARAIRDRIQTALAIETDRGHLTKLMKAFQEALVHDLDAAGFADMYAQTIAYGLLSARVANPEKKTADDFASHMRTNPFLKELMETFLKVGGRQGKAGGSGIDFDELGVSEVVELLDQANMGAVVRDFGDRNPLEDPIIHFYEHFLAAYDKEQKIRRGVFYTPRPVVSHMVRAVDDRLRTEYGLEHGLADTTTWSELADRIDGLTIPDGVPTEQAFVNIIDPATGTGTFLVEVIAIIHQTMVDHWTSGGLDEAEVTDRWNEYVPAHLLPRLHGFEVLMAPYAIAHLKVGLKLYETGYRFGGEDRARVYLTNALEAAPDSGQLRLIGVIPALAHEAQEVEDVKRTQRFTVILGNPPYSDASQNLGPQFERLIGDFRFYRGERIREKGAIRFEHVVNNDYIKFWGLCLEHLRKVPFGVACLITSNSFLAGKSFRGVRESLRASARAVCITDLHGEGWAGDLARAGVVDENVFEIQTGVSVTIVAKSPVDAAQRVEYGDLTGSYEDKVERLSLPAAGLDRVEVMDDPYSYGSFVPSVSPRHGEYWDSPQLDELFTLSVDGIKTSRDGLVIGNSHGECINKVRTFATSDLSQEEIERDFRFKSNRMDYDGARRQVRRTFDEGTVKAIAYRPFDLRFIYYDAELILSHRMNKMPGILCEGAEAIVCASRLSAPGFDHAFGARTLCAHKYTSHDINSRMFLVVHGDPGTSSTELKGGIRAEYLDAAGVPSELSATERSRVLGAYALAVLNAPSYRDRFLNDIQHDFPRVPLPRQEGLLQQLAALGTKLADAHSLTIALEPTQFPFCGSFGEVCAAPKLEGEDLWIGESSFLAGVRQDLWEHRRAGFQVCKSWFSAGGRAGLARRGQVITAEFVESLRTVLVSVARTLEIHQSIDETIEEHGGWPGAFQTTAT